MAHTTISDVVIWTKRIHGDPALIEKIAALPPGQALRLRVDGVSGAWVKMADGKDGRPTLGVRPLGETQAYWRRLYKERRGDLVPIELEAPTGRQIALVESPASPAERAAALEGLLGVAGQGWRSDEPYGARDELHDR